MHLRITLALAALALSSAAFAQIDSTHPDAFQVRYVSNLNLGDSYINITNTGTDATFSGTHGSDKGICVNVYAFDPAEELIACCSCAVTPNGLAKLSVTGDLISNTLTPATPSSIVVKLLATVLSVNAVEATDDGQPKDAGQAVPCDPGSAYDQIARSNKGANTGNLDPEEFLASGMRAWGTSLHKNTSTSPAGIAITEGAFVYGGLSEDEFLHITQFCGFIEGNATAPQNSGICNSCKTGGLFGARQ